MTDTVMSGLRIRMSHTGSKTWMVQKKIKDGRRIATTLGTYPGIPLRTAREEALKLQVEAESAIDRIEEAERKKAEAEAEALAARTLFDILAIYFENHIDRNLKPGPSRQERKAQLTYLNPFLCSRIDAIKRSDLQMAVDRKAAEGRVVTAMPTRRGPT
ncbi:MAG: Arm DNA-binding domain-containing protein [Cypionkella sp.]